jgi:hypothetical protein
MLDAESGQKVDRIFKCFFKIFGNTLPHYILVHFLAPGRVFPLLTFHAQYVTLIVNRKGFKNEATRCKSIL